jgi:hypothetical protein
LRQVRTRIRDGAEPGSRLRAAATAGVDPDQGKESQEVGDEDGD